MHRLFDMLLTTDTVQRARGARARRAMGSMGAVRRRRIRSGRTSCVANAGAQPANAVPAL